MTVYDKGDVARLAVVYTQSAVAVDPTTVRVIVRTPGGGVLTKTYGTDSEVVKDSTGHYHLDVSCDEVGGYAYRWDATGTGQSAGEGAFSVTRGDF